MRYLLAVLALLVCASVQAKEVEWSLVLPTEYDDGHALAQSDLAEVRIYVDGVPQSFPVQLTGVVDVRSGEHEICASVVTTPESYGEGEESDCSNLVTVDVQAPRPKPPTLLEAIVAFIKRLFGWFA